MLYRVLELNSGLLLYENEKLEKAKNYADLYLKNMGKHSRIQRCETIWSTQMLDEILKD